MFWRIFRGSIRGRRRSVILAAAAMAVGAAAVSALSNLAFGMRAAMEEEVRAFGASGVILPGVSRLSGRGTFGLLPQPGTLPEEAWADLRKALGDPDRAVERVLYAAGRIEGRSVAIVGREAARPAGARGDGPPYPIGSAVGGEGPQRLAIGGRAVEVRPAWSIPGGASDAGRVEMDLRDLQAILEAPGLVSAIHFDGAGDVAYLRRVRAAVEETLPGWTVHSVRRVVEAERALLLRLEAVMALVAGGILIGAALAMTATMLSMVMDRRREVGLLRALGGGARLIRAQLVLEAALAGVVGGVAGVLLGAVGAWGIGRGVFGQSLGISPAAAGVSMAVCVTTAVIAVGIPLRRALRIDPKECLTAPE